jgi:NodT family efflux transporter outer membrane factor (OMF) lipoprotein
MRGKCNARQAIPRGQPVLVGALSVLWAVLALGGCAVGPDYTRPDITFTEEWRAAGDPRLTNHATQAQVEVDREWWKALEDPALDRLVELAFQQNLPLQVAGLRIGEARAILGLARGRQYPQFQIASGSATAVGLSDNAANFANLPDRNFFDYQVGVDAAWEVDLWGKYKRSVEAETAAMRASEADYYYALVSVTAEVARTYVVIRTFEVLLDQARENTRLQEDGLRIAVSRFRAGATSELDPIQATTLLESTRATIPQLAASLQQARNALSTLLGQPNAAVDALLDGPKGIPKAPSKVAVGVPAEVVRRRPDVRAAELAAAAQSARIGVAKADAYPSFTVNGSAGLQASAGAQGGSTNLFEGDSAFYSFGPRIVWPFLDYGRVANNVRIEDARYQQARVQYRDTVLRATQEVEDALTGFLNAQEAVVFEQGSVTAAQRSVEIALVQYQEGAVDYQRVLDAQRSLLIQQNNLTQTSSSVATNWIALYKALGGGWETRQGRPVVPQPTQDEMKEPTDWGDLLGEPPQRVNTTGNPSAEKR